MVTTNRLDPERYSNHRTLFVTSLLPAPRRSLASGLKNINYAINTPVISAALGAFDVPRSQIAFSLASAPGAVVMG